MGGGRDSGRFVDFFQVGNISYCCRFLAVDVYIHCHASLISVLLGGTTVPILQIYF